MKKMVFKIVIPCSLVMLGISILMNMQQSTEQEKKQAEQEWQKQKKELRIRQKKEANAQYSAYRNFPFKHIVPLDKMKARFPDLFADVPEELHQKIADYAEFLYGANALERLAKENIFPTIFKWNAIGLAYNVMPFMDYTSNFFYFDQNRPNTTNLKGEREDHILAHFLNAEFAFQNAIEKISQIRLSMNELNKKIYDACDQDPKSEVCLQLQAQILEQQGAHQHAESEANGLFFDRMNIGLSLAAEYKFHLMPGVDCTPLIVKLLEGLAKDPELQELIAAFKVYWTLDYIKQHEVVPQIVVYPSFGKKQTQKALNKLYVLLKDVKGSGIRPRFSAHVNDLIWITQGDSIYKTNEYAQYYEEPYRIYYHSDFMGMKADYHLVHPETKQEIFY